MEWVSAILSKQSNLEIDVEDTAHLIMGLTSPYHGNKVICSLALDFIRQDPIRLCTAIGGAGSLRWNVLTGEIEVYGLNASSQKRLIFLKHECNDSYMAEMQSFIDLIAGQEPLQICSGEDDLEVLKIIDAARSSSQLRGAAFTVKSSILNMADL